MTGRALPLPALLGSSTIPVWVERPGAYTALADLTPVAVTLWLAVHSANGADGRRPCYATRDQLAATIGSSQRTVSRAMTLLRRLGLLVVIDRETERGTRRRRPPARWAIDPLAGTAWIPADVPDRLRPVPAWYPPIERALHEVASEDGARPRWYDRAVRQLDAAEAAGRIRERAMIQDLPDRVGVTMDGDPQSRGYQPTPTRPIRARE